MSEYIAHVKVTQRTETSKYLQEEKAKAIALVAASETAGGQTEEFTLRGCRTATWT